MADVLSTTSQSVSREDDSETVARENIAAIARLQEHSVKKRSAFARACDRIALVTARESFLIVHVVWFVTWLGINTGLFPLVPRFDPFPFTLLTTVVSLEAIFLTLFVLGSQNRLTQDTDKRAQLDLQVNLLAEQEMTMVLRMLREVCEHLGLDETISTPKFKELVKRTDVGQIAEQLDATMPSPATGKAASAKAPAQNTPG
jgi:uncharacterized membrane protein